MISSWCLILLVVCAGVGKGDDHVNNSDDDDGGSGVLLSLYRVPATADDELVDMPAGNRVKTSMNCYDSSIVTKNHTSRMFSFDETDLRPLLTTVEEASSLSNHSTIPIAAEVRFRQLTMDADEDLATLARYHHRHLAMLARTVYGGDRQAAVYDPLDSLDLGLEVDDDDDNQTANRTTRLWLRQVPRQCWAMLSDVDCTENRLSTLLPHTMPRIQQCIDIWFDNLLRFHTFYRLSDRLLNLTNLSNPCLREVLQQQRARLVRCLEEKQQLLANRRRRLDNATSKSLSSPLPPMPPLYVSKFIDAMRVSSGATTSSRCWLVSLMLLWCWWVSG